MYLDLRSPRRKKGDWGPKFFGREPLLTGGCTTLQTSVQVVSRIGVNVNEGDRELYNTSSIV